MARYVVIPRHLVTSLAAVDVRAMFERARLALEHSRFARANSRVVQEEARTTRRELWQTRLALRRVRAENDELTIVASSPHPVASTMSSLRVAAASRSTSQSTNSAARDALSRYGPTGDADLPARVKNGAA